MKRRSVKGMENHPLYTQIEQAVDQFAQRGFELAATKADGAEGT